jgi:hypothetical protein
MDFSLIVENNKIKVENVDSDELRGKVEKLAEDFFYKLYNLNGGNNQINASFFVNIIPWRDECRICFDQVEKPVKINCPCNNVYYHKNCLQKWFRKKKTCPMCRKEFIGCSKAYKGVFKSNPFTPLLKDSPGPKPNSGFRFQCDGKRHSKRSSFKTLKNALKHLERVHRVKVKVFSKNDMGVQWRCQHGSCNTEYIFPDTELVNHLQKVHHIYDVSLK